MDDENAPLSDLADYNTIEEKSGLFILADLIEGVGSIFLDFLARRFEEKSAREKRQQQQRYGEVPYYDDLPDIGLYAEQDIDNLAVSWSFGQLTSDSFDTKEQATNHLKHLAKDMGANAVICVSCSMMPEEVLCGEVFYKEWTAYGVAVEIGKKHKYEDLPEITLYFEDYEEFVPRFARYEYVMTDSFTTRGMATRHLKHIAKERGGDAVVEVVYEPEFREGIEPQMWFACGRVIRRAWWSEECENLVNEEDAEETIPFNFDFL